MPSHHPPPQVVGWGALLRAHIVTCPFKLLDGARVACGHSPPWPLTPGPHRFTGTVIIGAGTGLTAAMSVLRELVFRKGKGDRVPKYCWCVPGHGGPGGGGMHAWVWGGWYTGQELPLCAHCWHYV